MTRVRQSVNRAVNGDQETGPSLTTTLIVIAIVAGSVFLTWKGKINGDAYVALTSAIVGGVLVTRGVHTGSKATVDPPPGD